LTGPATVEPEDGAAIEMVGFEEVLFGGFFPPGAAAAPAAKRRRKKRASARWRSGCWAADGLRRESMRRSL
jgi:hypothetical protein